LKRIPGKFAGVLMAITLTAVSGFAQLADKKALTLSTAKQIAAAAEAEATSNKFTMVICILDDGGNLMYLERMDDSQLASVQIAQGKAHTALAFKRPTKMMEDGVAAGRTATLSLPGAVMIHSLWTVKSLARLASAGAHRCRMASSRRLAWTHLRKCWLTKLRSND